MGVCSSVPTRPLSLRGECGALPCSQWIATGFRPRDDNTLLSLLGGNGVRDAAIHRISREAFGFVSSLTGSQWIATGYALAMTRLERTPSEHNFVIARRERSERRGNPSCLTGTRAGLSLRSLVHSGSPRAYALAMTIWGKGCPRDDIKKNTINTRGGDFRSISLYSSPPPAHPTMGFCEAKSFFDDAGPRRVSNLSFVKNPFHSNQRGSQHGSLCCCYGCWGCCCCA